MGRFDVLTTLDTKPAQPAPLPEKFGPVQPAQLPEDLVTSKPAKKQTSKPENQQASLPASLQTSKEVRKQTFLPANQQRSKPLKKFSSYLREESLRGLKRIALETDRKDYEVLQEAVDRYLEWETGTK